MYLVEMKKILISLTLTRAKASHILLNSFLSAWGSALLSFLKCYSIIMYFSNLYQLLQKTRKKKKLTSHVWGKKNELNCCFILQKRFLSRALTINHFHLWLFPGTFYLSHKQEPLPYAWLTSHHRFTAKKLQH